MHLYDPLYGRIDIPERIEPVINSRWFRRLRHLRQLGLCYLSFPSGNHTRFEHSIGAFHLASVVCKMSLRPLGVLSAADYERLAWLMQLGALCHDIGHGPFSHMTENVLEGLGSKITHEEVGAAIVSSKLKNELKYFGVHDITPTLIGQLITKSVKDDPVALCAMEIVSSDLDADRLDFLHRDSHYCGQEGNYFDPDIDLRDVWELKRFNKSLYFELTESGIRYAEKILFLRRNNYQRIVYESRHMCATAMFEKAVLMASRTNSEFGRRCQQLLRLEMDWTDKQSVEDNFPVIQDLYGLVDYEALNLLEEAHTSPAFKQLIQNIRRGNFYSSICRLRWDRIHYLAKQLILNLRGKSGTFQFCRYIESILGEMTNVNSIHIVCHVPSFSKPALLKLGVFGGNLLDDRSALGKFLYNDIENQYAIELFLGMLDSESRDKISTIFQDIFIKGHIDIIQN